jgi:alpha-2-macroglobulin
MSTRYFSRLIAFIAFCYMASCSLNKSVVKVTDRNFSEEVELQQNLVFTFNNDLAPDSVLNVWEDAAYIKFTPEVKGKFKWTSKNELIFSPDLGFQPSTDYKAELTDLVFRHGGKGLKLSDEKSFAFHTPYLNLVSTGIFWARKETDKSITEARINLIFNYNIDPATLKGLLKLQVDGKEKAFDIYTSTVSQTIQVAIAESSEKYDDKVLKILISPGLKCIESQYLTKDKIEFETKIPSKDRFQIISATGLYEDEMAYINVITNQEVLTENIKSLLTIDPDLKYTIETHEAGFMIKGDFKSGETYNLKVDKALKGIFGGSLYNDFELPVSFGEQAPFLGFTSKKGIYLTSKGEKNIGIRIISLPKVKVTVYKIYANNILQYLDKSGDFNRYSYEDDYYGDYYGYVNYEEMGDIILEKEYETKDLKKANGASLLNLNLNDINSSFKGIYAIKVASADQLYLRASKTVSISDIGMIVKETENDIYVFANSILSANAVPAVDVNLISSNNQEVYKAVTDKDGVARFIDLKKKAPGFKVRMVTAQSGEDFNYIHFNQSAVETSRHDVGGARTNTTGYQAFIYGDREIYRPGETINLNVIFRNEQWETTPGMPVKMKVLLPNGEEFTSRKAALNKQGAYETAIQLPSSTVTGTYNVEVYTGNDVLLSSKSLSVEEFIPDRIKVDVTLNNTEFRLGDKVNVQAVALNLFGPPASDRNYEMQFQLSRKAFYSKDFSEYTFSINGRESLNFEDDEREGTTNADGKFQESFAFKPQYENTGILQGNIYTTVFDESGRPVHRVQTLDVITQDVFYGIKNIDYYVATNQDLKIPIVALTKDGKPYHIKDGQIQIIRYNWQTIYERNSYGSGRYVSHKQEVLLEDKYISTIQSNYFYSFRPMQSGEYEVRVKKPGADSYVSQYFYAYGWGSTSNSSFEVSKEGNVTIELDKDKYEVGDRANILFKAPFAGRILVTVERDKVYEYFYVETDKKSATASIEVTDKYLPNAYITATLIKPVGDGSMPLTVAHGFLPLFAGKKENKLPLEISAAKQSRSRTKQKICIKSKPESDIEMTIAIVDEGILQLKRTETPDPYAYFFRKKALEVNSYDLYPNLLPELKMQKSSMAGDGYDLDKRVNPLTNKRVKLVSFWSGIKRTDSNGEVCHEIDIPQFSGDLRIMAVAYKNDAFGSATANMKVADPIVVSTSLPRFLSPGDTMLVPVTLTNTTTKPASALSKLVLTGPLTVIGNADQSVSIKPNSEMMIQYKVVAQTVVSTAKIKTDITAFNEHFIEENDITIRPATSLLKMSGADRLEANSEVSINMGSTFVPSSIEAKLTISKSPLIQLTKNLDYLVGYPYGCVEQTVSKAFPQLYFTELMKSMNRKTRTGENPNYNVQEAVRKLQGMQLNNGGLSYWEGGYEESWWGSVYAAHFMLEAKKAGFEVNQSTLDKLYGYLQQKIKTKDTYRYSYYDQNILKNKLIAPKEIFYSMYVLALAGRQDMAIMNYYKSNTAFMAMDSRYLLAATYKLAGDNMSYRSLLPANFSNEESVNAFDGSFYSYIRDMAISLNMMIETDPDNPQIGVLAKHLSEAMRGKRYLNTQENAFAMLALGKLAVKANQSNITAEVRANDRKIGDYKDGNLVITKNIAGKDIKIVTKGSGSLYYYWEMEGLSMDGKYKEEDSYLKARKTFYDKNGRELSGTDFKQNDLIVVRIALSTTDNSTVENVVITDLLPAGFEIENPRLSESADMEWIKNNSAPEHYDIRDDRINLFCTATGSVKYFYYMVRAVSKGNFRMGPVSADAMYNGEYHSYNGGGMIKVSEKGKNNNIQ